MLLTARIVCLVQDDTGNIFQSSNIFLKIEQYSAEILLKLKRWKKKLLK